MPNDGVRSSWNGHSPVSRRCAGRAQLRPRADELGEVDRVADALARVVGVARHPGSARQAVRDEPLRPRAEGEPVGHAGEVVEHAVGLVGARDARRELLRVLAEPVEEPAQHALDLLVLGRARSGPRYTRSNMNERSRSIARPTVSLCTMSPAARGLLDEVVHQRVDPLRAAVAEDGDVGGGQVARR